MLSYLEFRNAEIKLYYAISIETFCSRLRYFSIGMQKCILMRLLNSDLNRKKFISWHAQLVCFTVILLTSDEKSFTSSFLLLFNKLLNEVKITFKLLHLPLFSIVAFYNLQMTFICYWAKTVSNLFAFSSVSWEVIRIINKVSLECFDFSLSFDWWFIRAACNLRRRWYPKVMNISSESIKM